MFLVSSLVLSHLQLVHTKVWTEYLFIGDLEINIHLPIGLKWGSVFQIKMCGRVCVRQDNDLQLLK